MMSEFTMSFLVGGNTGAPHSALGWSSTAPRPGGGRLGARTPSPVAISETGNILFPFLYYSSINYKFRAFTCREMRTPSHA